MALTCNYCESACAEGATKCASCGAPVGAGAPPPDYRFCPFCKRRLLALGSPACNYCGRALPESYLKAREAQLRRIGEASAGSSEDRERLEQDADGPLKRALKTLFDLDDTSRKY